MRDFLIVLTCLLVMLVSGSSASGSPPAPDSLRLGAIQTLLDELGMGYSRAEMEATLRDKVRQGMARQDSSLAAAATPYLADVVQAAFDGRAAEVAALQERVNRPLLEAFSAAEIEDLTTTFRSEPVRRLLRMLQGQDEAVQREGGRLFNALGRDVQVLLKAKLTVEGILPPATPPASPPPAAVPPLLQTPNSARGRQAP